MKGLFDAQRFAAQIRTKRGTRSLRSIVGELEGVSLSTLSRIENGKMPDMKTFLSLCDWLDALPDDFMTIQLIPQEPEKSILEQIALLLRMDATLDLEITKALIVLLHRIIEPQGNKTR
ncbi:MAG: helix-turn-helix transcriptional regulator [Ktedonobacteraceae bacterium]|nr:helix-turn-helix transcriptional regulator [Ktedonobacteraceae bacterium]